MGTKLLEFSIGRGSGALEGLMLWLHNLLLYMMDQKIDDEIFQSVSRTI